MKALLTGIFTSIIFLLSFHSQAIEFQGSVVCRHRGGNGKILLDFKKRTVEFQGILSTARALNPEVARDPVPSLASARFGFPDSFAAPVDRASFSVNESPGFLGRMDINTNTFSTMNGPFYANATLSIWDADLLISESVLERARGQVTFSLNQVVGFEIDPDTGLDEPVFAKPITFRENVSCEISR